MTKQSVMDLNVPGKPSFSALLALSLAALLITVIALPARAQLSELYAFQYNSAATSSYPDGAIPMAELIQGADGNYYTTTSIGGAGTCPGEVEDQIPGCGAVVKITPAGTLSVLYSFPYDTSTSTAPNGWFPQAGLVQGKDGNFYGVATEGGIGGDLLAQLSRGETLPLFLLTEFGRTPRQLGLQPFLLARVVLHHLVERRGGHIDLVQPLQFGALQVDGLAHRGKLLHLFHQLPGKVRQRLGNLQPQAGDSLHHAFHRSALDGLPDLCRAQPGGLLGFRIGRLAGGLRFPPDPGEFFLYFGLGALGAHRRFGWFRHFRRST